ncbi:MAG: acetylornithine transaminase [Actinomycetota bacterium]
MGKPVTTTGELVELESRVHVPTYRRLRVAFVRGEGCRLWDAEGKEYLDFLAGIAVTAIGHAHPRFVEAVCAQVGRLVHVSNLFYTEPQLRVAERLTELLGWGRVFFANSGAEANEAALKLARKCAKASGNPAKFRVVSAQGAFHGRTLGTLAATPQPAKQAPFAPMPDGFDVVPFGDLGALDAVVSDDTAAVILEVVQGEGGVRVAGREFLHAVRAACDRHGALLVFDEVQTGIGRTGRWFAFQHFGVVPDVITLAKGLGGGLPIGACVARDEFAEVFAPGDHATTFGGGPAVCAGALAVLDVIRDEGLVEHAEHMGRYLGEGLARLCEGSPHAVGERGLGLLRALQLAGPFARRAVEEGLEAGLVVNDVAPDALRLAPPLVVGREDVDALLDRLPGVLERAARA